VGATEGNPLGHWEPQDALDLNQAFLSRHGTSWFDPTLRLQSEAACTREQQAAFIEQIKSFLRPLAEVPLLVIKEPRITALSTFWFEAARQLGRAIRIAIPVRHPAEVIASLAARDGATPELASALWLKYNLLGERASRVSPRVFVDYTSLLSDWRAELFRIAAALSLDLSVRDEASVDEFLRQDLRRQRHRGEICDTFGLSWINRVYAALAAATRGEPLETAVLDEIFESYRGCERTFRIALHDFHTRFTVDTQRNPRITTLIYATAGRDSQLLRACINSSWYRAQNPDVLAAGSDPYEHWIAYGFTEGRLPCDDPLALLDSLMREKASRPVTPTSPAAATDSSAQPFPGTPR
jgi:hypothetical protein